MTIIAPSILSADFARLGEECQKMLDCGADWLHVDVMDGHFVPNLTIGPPVVSALRKAFPGAFLDCHLMIEQPELWIERMVKAGASSITIHLEATTDAVTVVKRIKSLGCLAGVAIKPATPADALSYELLELVDMILVMTVEPGFGGQAMIPECLEKVAQLRTRFTKHIQVDGGIGLDNCEQVHRVGANVIVAGSSIFSSPDPAEVIRKLRLSK